MGFSNILKRTWKPIQHLYVVLVIITSWVFFRAEDLSQAMAYFAAMTDITNWDTTALQYQQVISKGFVYIFALGVIFSLPVYDLLKKNIWSFSEGSMIKSISLVYAPKLVLFLVLVLLSIMKVASSTYNPFIYFRF